MGHQPRAAPPRRLVATPSRSARRDRAADARAASGAISTRTIQAGGNGARTSRAKRRTKSARWSGFGMPLRVTLPSSASSTVVSSSCSMSSAGTTSTRQRAVESPPLAKRCTRPAGTTTVSPASATIRRRPMRNFIVPSSTWKRSSCSGCTCAPGTWPSGERASSNSSSSPAVSAAVCRKVICSPLTGLLMVCPVKAIPGSLHWLDPMPGASCPKRRASSAAMAIRTTPRGRSAPRRESDGASSARRTQTFPAVPAV